MKARKLARIATKLEERSEKIPGTEPFRRRSRDTLIFLAAILALSWGSTYLTGFDYLQGLESFPKAFSWLGANFVPNDASWASAPRILNKLTETVLLSVAATVFASILAFFLALFCSKTTQINPALALGIRGLATTLRSIPVVAWAMILLLSFGQSPLTGLLAILIESLGFLIRAFAEAMDESSGSSVEALKASGASWSQTVAQSVVPSVLPQVLSWVLYMIETNIRSATLVGILTGTGIGFTFNLFYKSFRYQEAALVVIAVVLVVLLIEQLSNRVRREIL